MRLEMMRKRSLLLVLTVCIVLVLAACSSTGSGSSRQESSSVVVVQTAEPECLDPYVNNLTHVANIARHIYDNLTWLDRDLKVTPRLAESWKATGPTTWQVTLRDDAKFTNGDPVTAEDVVASIQYGAKSNSAAFFTNWKSESAIDDHTVRVETKSPDPTFASTMTRVYVMPASILKSDPDQLCSKPVGSGPYKMSEWRKGQDIRLKAVKGHFLHPKIDNVTIKAVPEGSTRVNMLLSGEADLIANVPTDSIDRIDNSSGGEVLSKRGIRRIVNIIDTRKAPFDDIRVRRAISYAVDMKTITDTVLGGHGVQTVGVHPPISAYADPDLKPYPYDPAKAKKLLAEAGFPNGFAMDYHYPNGRWLKDAEVAQAIAGYLGKVGIKANLKTTQYDTFFGDWSTGKYSGMSMIGVIDFDGSPDATNRLFLTSDGPWSFSWHDSKFDAIQHKAETTLDQARRVSMFQELDDVVHDRAIWCCGYDQDEIYGANKNLNYDVHPGERIVLWDASWKK